MTASHLGSGDRFLASDQAQQYVALDQARQYILSGTNSNLNIYLSYEAFEKETELKNLFRVALQNQSLHYPNVTDTPNTPHTQLTQALSLLQSSTKALTPSTTQDLHWTSSRSPASPALLDPFWQRPKFQTWYSTPESSLRLIRGSHTTRHHVKLFCLDLIALLREARIPLFWVLKPSDADSQASGAKAQDVVKRLVLQVLGSQEVSGSAWQGAKEELAARLCCRLRCAESRSDWVEVLAMAIALLPAQEICLIVDVHMLDDETDTESREHGDPYIDLANAFSALQNGLRSQGCKTIVKTLLVSYGGAVFRGEDVLPFSDVLIAVENSKANLGGPAQRRRVVRRLLHGSRPCV
ncbi:hypothetical protein IQ07DRAFT_101628 [Pyrenochaeta sp. DS3sAY3a]|nr:hypothetical protein IQ07DRAFT_101628 [Pyrenochaeta sp. DS3sAY3a]